MIKLISMLKRKPDLPRHMDGGPENPLGARAMYLGSSLYRIHGSNEPWTIGTNVSSGCIRMRNEDVVDLHIPVTPRDLTDPFGERRMEFQLTLRKRGITDKAVLRAMDEVPREQFVEALAALRPVARGGQQTVKQRGQRGGERGGAARGPRRRRPGP